MPGEAKVSDHVTFRCPFCNCKVRAPRRAIGHRGHCPQCRRTVRVQEKWRGHPEARSRLSPPQETGLVYMPLPSVPGGRAMNGYAGNVLAILATVCAAGSAMMYILVEEAAGAAPATGRTVTAIVFWMSILALGLARGLNVIHRQLMENGRRHWGPTIRLGGNGH